MSIIKSPEGLTDDERRLLLEAIQNDAEAYDDGIDCEGVNTPAAEECRQIRDMLRGLVTKLGLDDLLEASRE